MSEEIKKLGRRTGLLETLEMDVVEASKERVVVTMPVMLRHLQPRGYLHGGASLARSPRRRPASAHRSMRRPVWWRSARNSTPTTCARCRTVC